MLCGISWKRQEVSKMQRPATTPPHTTRKQNTTKKLQAVERKRFPRTRCRCRQDPNNPEPRRCSRWQSKMRNAGPAAIWVTILLIFLLLKKYCCGVVSGSGYLWRKKPKHVSQTCSSRVTPRRLCLNSREQQAVKGCQEQGSSKVGSIRTPGHCTLYIGSALGHTTGTRALVPSLALGAAARNVSQGKHRRNHHLPHFPPFQGPVTLQLTDFHCPWGHLGTPA